VAAIDPAARDDTRRPSGPEAPPPRRTYCTYFDHRYLTKGLALYRSLEEHGGEFELHVLCLSAECHDVLSRLGLGRARLVTLEELEAHDPELGDL
jgi:hypothetical protein